MMNEAINDVEICQVDIYDVQLLQQISTICFTESFAEVNTAEDMKAYLNTTFSAQNLLKEINTIGVAFHFMWYAGKIIGYCKLNAGGAQTESFGNRSLELERFYILKEFQNRRIGQFILNGIIENARAQKFGQLWLGVWEKNEGAIRLYQRNGFIPFGSHGFLLGNDMQTDILMRIELQLNE